MFFFPQSHPCAPLFARLLLAAVTAAQICQNSLFSSPSFSSQRSHDKKGSLAQETRRNFLRWKGTRIPGASRIDCSSSFSLSGSIGRKPLTREPRNSRNGAVALKLLSRPKISAKSCVEKPRAKSLFLEQPRECVRVCLCT